MLIIAGAALMLGRGAAADDYPAQASLSGFSLCCTRVVARDAEALAKFYEAVFGLKEVNRTGKGAPSFEIILNFGNTAEAAKANTNAALVITQTNLGVNDRVPHLLLSVPDVVATLKAIQDAGGLAGKPRSYGGQMPGLQFALAVDPEGNAMEVSQWPKR
ncbi:MAG: VOC family protein [Steroidobacteraceae bacterium]